MKMMYKIFDSYSIDPSELDEDLDLKSVVAVQQRQQHNGFLCTEKDKNEMRYHDRYKTMMFNDKLVQLTIQDEYEERLMDLEQIQLATRIEVEQGTGPAKTS